MLCRRRTIEAFAFVWLEYATSLGSQNTAINARSYFELQVVRKWQRRRCIRPPPPPKLAEELLELIRGLGVSGNGLQWRPRVQREREGERSSWCGAWGTNVSPGEPAYKQGTESGGSALYRVQSLCQPSVGQHLATEGQGLLVSVVRNARTDSRLIRPKSHQEPTFYRKHFYISRDNKAGLTSYYLEKPRLLAS
ncbi:hypothetical protein HYQ44_000032 [Verticillium longisporum]|nr:hypothetical protein HYQ44_000032 [Verticillium longisporum]